MSEEMEPAEPTASSLKKELRSSLELLIKDFAVLMHFVAEIATEGTPTPLLLSKEDVHDLLTITLEIQDAANDIAFEAGKIKDKLDRLS
jgi:hypothetical protein